MVDIIGTANATILLSVRSVVCSTSEPIHPVVNVNKTPIIMSEYGAYCEEEENSVWTQPLMYLISPYLLKSDSNINVTTLLCV